jgi:hypothetical protein
MFFRTLFRLLPSLLIAACFCQSGLGAVQWEMSWEATAESTFESTGIAVAGHPDDGDCPSVDVCSFSGSMETQPPNPSGQYPTILFENQLFEMQVQLQSLRVVEPEGEVIQVPWRNLKVPI